MVDRIFARYLTERNVAFLFSRDCCIHIERVFLVFMYSSGVLRFSFWLDGISLFQVLPSLSIFFPYSCSYIDYDISSLESHLVKKFHPLEQYRHVSQSVFSRLS